MVSYDIRIPSRCIPKSLSYEDYIKKVLLKYIESKNDHKLKNYEIFSFNVEQDTINYIRKRLSTQIIYRKCTLKSSQELVHSLLTGMSSMTTTVENLVRIFLPMTSVLLLHRNGEKLISLISFP